MSFIDQAKTLVNGDRQEAYQHPSDDFAKVITLQYAINSKINEKYDQMAELSNSGLGEQEVAVKMNHYEMTQKLYHALNMIQVKVARILDNPTHEDSWVDIAGYVETAHKIIEKAREDAPYAN